MNWWAIFEALAGLAFSVLQWSHTHGQHGAFSTKLVITNDADGSVVGELPGPHLTF